MLSKVPLSIVIPTKGRNTLQRAIESCMPYNQNNHVADVIVVADIYGPLEQNVQDLVSRFTAFDARYFELDMGYNDWGYPQMDYIYRLANVGERFIMNIGDDDVLVENILERIALITNRNGIQPYLFQAELHPSPHRGNKTPVIIWNDEDRSIERKKITGQNLIVPNIPEKMGIMVDDFEFIRQTVELWHGRVKWIPVVTTKCY